MTDYYVVDDHIAGHSPQVYTYSELIKALNNANVRWLFDDYSFGNDLTLYRDVKSIKRLPDPWGAELEIKYGSSQLIQGAMLNRLLYSAHKWYQQEQACEDWDGKMNYLAQSSLLGEPIFVPFPLVASGRYGRHAMRHKAHSSWKYKHGRVGHTMSANGRYTIHKRELASELYNYPLTHRNRKDRRHGFILPVFDDNEYRTAKHSTGWKHSTHCRHQYQVHI